jgi:subtilase family serine protease
MSATVYLAMHDEAGFEKALAALYDPKSPTYHQWMEEEDYAKYAATAADVATVQKELEKHGLTVVPTNSHGGSIRVLGSASAMEAAFQTEIHTLTINGKTAYANVKPAQLTGSAGSLVKYVSGLEQHTILPKLKQALNPRTRLAPAKIPLSKTKATGGLGAYITDTCLQPATTYTYPTAGASLPVGVYYGISYNPLTPTGASSICDFTPQQLQAHYGLSSAIAGGLNGAGQTIVLLEAYGYPTIEADANAFSSLAGLPALTSANFGMAFRTRKREFWPAGMWKSRWTFNGLTPWRRARRSWLW